MRELTVTREDVLQHGSPSPPMRTRGTSDNAVLMEPGGTYDTRPVWRPCLSEQSDSIRRTNPTKRAWSADTGLRGLDNPIPDPVGLRFGRLFRQGVAVRSWPVTEIPEGPIARVRAVLRLSAFFSDSACLALQSRITSGLLFIMLTALAGRKRSVPIRLRAFMSVQPRDSRTTAFLDGGGRMGALMRSYDWSRTPLGDPADWPAALKTAIATCLSSRFPMVVWWGPELLMLYNDAWQPILGDTKHPAGLGRPGRESWPETWPIVGAQFEDALKGIASWAEDLLLASDRHGFIEESYFTYSHGPLRDASGEVVGVLSVVKETTARVLNERRLQTLARLSTATLEATSGLEPLGDMCQLLVDTLCLDNPDAAFAVQYVANSPQRVQRVAVAGLDVGRLPESVESTDHDAWGIAEALRRRSYVALNFDASDQLPGGVWPEPVTEVVVFPLFHSGRDEDLLGVLVVGVNSRLRLDGPYIRFLRLVATQFTTAISASQFARAGDIRIRKA